MYNRDHVTKSRRYLRFFVYERDIWSARIPNLKQFYPLILNGGNCSTQILEYSPDYAPEFSLDFGHVICARKTWQWCFTSQFFATKMLAVSIETLEPVHFCFCVRLWFAAFSAYTSIILLVQTTVAFQSCSTKQRFVATYGPKINIGAKLAPPVQCWDEQEHESLTLKSHDSKRLLAVCCLRTCFGLSM